MAEAQPHEGSTAPLTSREITQGILGLALSTILVPAMLFLSAGTLQWPEAWLYSLTYLGAALGGRLIVLRKNPDTLRERARALSSDTTMPGDRLIVLLLGLLGPLVMMVAAGINFRFALPPEISPSVQAIGFILLLLGYLIAVWALGSNPFFSAVARIQTDRGQYVVATGPYRWIRHPGYAGGILGTLGAPLLLGSFWALIPATIIIVVYFIRTGFEDRMLRKGLEGYQDYALQTRYRIIPAIW
ncbi:MAG: isoprenylcysteine carboxylmethyltransferase family protein [Anaerolineales bacterium]|nr:isoprenylcysteine carboxylmethyltransferase family protein [Anaerolineales bacterium]